MSMDRQEVTLLIHLDLSTAFDTIDHTILLDILENDFGIIGNAKEWIKSFLCKRQQHVLVEEEISKPYQLDRGVPQGSCLGPVLFLLYESSLFQAGEQASSNSAFLKRVYTTKEKWHGSDKK